MKRIAISLMLFTLFSSARILRADEVVVPLFAEGASAERKSRPGSMGDGRSSRWLITDGGKLERRAVRTFVGAVDLGEEIRA